MDKNKAECPKYKIDEACVTISSAVKEKLAYLWQSDECLNCDLLQQNKEPIRQLEAASFNVDTRFGSKIQIQGLDKFENQTCELSYHFVDTGKYLLRVTDNFTKCDRSLENCLKCELEAIDEPSLVSTYLPIIYSLIGYFAIGLFWILLKKLHKRGIFASLLRRNSSNLTESTVDLGNSPVTNDPSIQGEIPPKTRKRVKSLDTFRSIAITIMIFVNYGGGQYYFFDHLPWNGLSVADLVFPWFIWIMGVSMAISMKSLVKRGTPKKKIFYKIVKRSLILFALGIILNTSYGANDLTKIRIPGVLQRFAISYFTVATVHMFSAHIDTELRVNMTLVMRFCRDILLYWIEWLIMLAFLIAHVVITFSVNEPGCPKGYLGPGGLHDHGMYQNCTGGASGYIDRWFFGSEHIYNHPTPKVIYKTVQAYDPEGMLGSLTSIFLVFLGLQAGKILLIYKESSCRLSRWISWSILCGIIAAVLCKASKDDGWIPVNKNLWSVSYIMTTGCMAFFLLSLCYYIQDVKQWWNGAPFFYPGMNSILLYVGHQLTGDLFPWKWATEPSHSAYLGVNLWGCSLWVLISFVLYKKKMFLSI